MTASQNDGTSSRITCGMALVRAPIRKTSMPEKQDAGNFDRKGVYSRSFVESQRRDAGDYFMSPFDKGKVYYRSFSHPQDTSKEDINDKSCMYDRSSSQPKLHTKHNFDVNHAIHDEIVSSPWGTYRRQPRKRDRYAIYIPEVDRADDTSEHCGISSPSNTTDEHKKQITTHLESSVLYGTYRRAPRTYPRLGFEPEDRRTVKTVYEQPWGFSNISCESVPLSRVSNDSYQINKREVSDAREGRGSVPNHSDVKHLFSVPLKDVNPLNSCAPYLRSNYVDKNKKLKKIENDLYNHITKRQESKEKRQHLEKMTSDNTDNAEHKKPFFYCRWITNYPKTFFCKYYVYFYEIHCFIKDSLVTQNMILVYDFI